MVNVVVCESNRLIRMDLCEAVQAVDSAIVIHTADGMEDAVAVVGQLEKLAALIVNGEAGEIAKTGLVGDVTRRGGCVILLGTQDGGDHPNPAWMSVPVPFTSERIETAIRLALTAGRRSEGQSNADV
jgi:hypothetical protein